MSNVEHQQYDPASPADLSRRLAMTHIPADRRAAVEAVLALDAALGQILRTTREPMIGQMRLTWWHQALTDLDHQPPPAQPVLQALARDVLPTGIAGAGIAAMVEGWEVLLEPVIDAAALSDFAEQRGGRLFRLLGKIVAPREAVSRSVAAAGQGWALADLAPRLTDRMVSDAAQALAEQRFAAAFAERWPRRLRPLGTLALVAKDDLRNRDSLARPALALRLIGHRVTGK